jgi:hypothetical protein
MWSAFVPGRLGVTAQWRVFFDFLVCFVDFIVSLARSCQLLPVASGCYDGPLLAERCPFKSSMRWNLRT